MGMFSVGKIENLGSNNSTTKEESYVTVEAGKSWADSLISAGLADEVRAVGKIVLERSPQTGAALKEALRDAGLSDE